MSTPKSKAAKKPRISPGALRLDPNQGGTDYTLQPGHTGCWITIDGLSVHVYRTPDKQGVAVAVLPKGAEGDDPIAELHAPFSAVVLEASPDLEKMNREATDKAIARSADDSGSDGDSPQRSPCRVGQVVPITEATFVNLSGGTESVGVTALVKILARWWDYETGWHFVAEVQSQTSPAISTFTHENVPVPSRVFVSEHKLAKVVP